MTGRNTAHAVGVVVGSLDNGYSKFEGLECAFMQAIRILEGSPSAAELRQHPF